MSALSTKKIQKPVIFLAEDDEHISYLVTFLLERQDYIVEVCRDGFEFLDLVKESLPPDLILLDLMLPFVDGFELIRQVRQLDGWQNIPIIALSGLSRDEEIVRAFKAGANDYVTKPFQPQELMVRIDRFIEKKHDLVSGEN